MNEAEFDQEFNVVDATKDIVDKAKAEVKSKYGNKKKAQTVDLEVYIF